MFLNNLHCVYGEKRSFNRQSNNLKSAYPVLVGTDLLHLESLWTFTFCYLTCDLEKQQILLRHHSKKKKNHAIRTDAFFA